MTRLGSGKLKPRTDWVDLRDIVGSAVERAAKLLRRRPVRVEIDPAMPLLRLDAMLMEQVIFNLIDNACKYSPPGTPVTVWTALRDGHAVIEVCDQGPGIPAEDRERVFDMFYRVEEGDSRAAGTGSGPGDLPGHRGSPWRPHLRPTRPERRRHLHRDPPAGGRADQPAGPAGRSGRMILANPERLGQRSAAMLKILVIDDEPQIRKFLRISLTATGYKVVEAETGAQGAEAAKTERPDLVILDLGLPDLDGQEVITLIREHSQVPIIVLSVRADETDKVEALDRGADDYVVKPFGIGELMARVRAASRQRSAAASDPDTLRIGSLTIDLTRRLAVRDGIEQRLSPKEHALLSLLTRNRDKILTHAQILREVWGPAHTHDTAYLRVYVNQLRQKLEADPGRPALIITEPGVGYRLRSGEDR